MRARGTKSCRDPGTHFCVFNRLSSLAMAVYLCCLWMEECIFFFLTQTNVAERLSINLPHFWDMRRKKSRRICKEAVIYLSGEKKKKKNFFLSERARKILILKICVNTPIYVKNSLKNIPTRQLFPALLSHNGDGNIKAMCPADLFWQIILSSLALVEARDKCKQFIHLQEKAVENMMAKYLFQVAETPYWMETLPRSR